MSITKIIPGLYLGGEMALNYVKSDNIQVVTSVGTEFEINDPRAEIPVLSELARDFADTN